MPVGANIPLVIQAGKWRRQVIISNVASCVNTAVPASLTHLPRTHFEGDIPLIGVVTGAADAVECALRKVGIADSEFTDAGGTGRVNLYVGSGAPGAEASASTPAETVLESTPATMSQYDMVMFGCQGAQYDKTAATQQTLINYANAGGRVLATHYGYVWLYDDVPFSGAAQWAVNNPITIPDQIATVDTSFPKGSQLADWLQVVGASTTPGQMPIANLKQDQNGVNPPTQSWLTASGDVMQFTFNTPVGAPPNQQCGRVLFNEYHVEPPTSGVTTPGTMFPSECATGPMTAQEKLLEYSLFDLTNVLTSDTPPTATITVSNSPTQFVQGDSGDTVSIDVTNTSTTVATSSSLSVTAVLPQGLSASAMYGTNSNTGWICAASTLTCTRATGLAENSSDPITLTVNVASSASAGSPVTVSATVSGGGLAAGATGQDVITIPAAPVVTWPTPAAITFGTPLSNVQLDATASVPGSFTYSPVAGTIPSAGPETLSATFTPTDTTNYTTATATVSLTVNQATPKITWVTPGAISSGTALSATQLGATSSVAGTFAYSPAAGTVVSSGTQPLSVIFTPADTTDYTTATATVMLTVNQETPKISWAPPPAISYGTALDATQLNASAPVKGDFTYSPAAGTVLTSGTQTLSVTFTPADITDYTTATSQVTLTVNKATPTIAWTTPTAIPYGTALSPTQLNATSPVAGTYSYSPAAGAVLTSGSQTLSVTFTPTDTTDYTTALSQVTLTVNKATPTITWTTPGAISSGTALSATQLNASSSVAGSFTYSPASGTVLSAGSQPLSVTFTPTDTADYTTATSQVTLTVNKAAPTITWATPAAIPYGTALSATQLNASSSVAGAFTYSPASGTVLSAGSRPLSVTFTPTDTTDYATATATVSLTVNQATPTISWAAPAAIPYGTALSATQLNASSSVAGTFTYSPASGTVLAAGTQTLSVTFTPTDTTDYTPATATVSLTVNSPIVPALTFAPISTQVEGAAPFAVSATSASSGAITYAVVIGPATIGGNMVTVTGAGKVVLMASQAASGSYAAATALTSFVVSAPFTLTSPSGTTTGSGTSTSVAAGSAASFSLTLAPAAGTTFPDPITFAATGLPPGATVTFSPAMIAAGSAATTVTLSIQTTSTQTERNEQPISRNPLAPLALGFLLLPLLGMKAEHRRLRQMPRLPAVLLAVGLSLGAVLGMSGCAGGSMATKPVAQTYTVVVTATDTTTKVQSSTNLTLTVQ